MKRNRLFHFLFLSIVPILFLTSIVTKAEEVPVRTLETVFQKVKDKCASSKSLSECIEYLSDHAQTYTRTWQDSFAFTVFTSGPINNFSGIAKEFRYKTIKVEKAALGSDADYLNGLNDQVFNTSWDNLFVNVGIGYQLEAKAFDAKIASAFTIDALPGSLALNPDANYFEAVFAGIFPTEAFNSSIDCKTAKDLSKLLYCAIPTLPSIDQNSFTNISAQYKTGFKAVVANIDEKQILFCPQVLDAWILQKDPATQGMATPVVRVQLPKVLVKRLQNSFESDDCKQKQANIRVQFLSGKNTLNLGFNSGDLSEASNAARYIYARNHYFYAGTFCNTAADNCSVQDNYSRFWITTESDTSKSPSIFATFFTATASSQSITTHVYSQLPDGKRSIANNIPDKPSLDASSATDIIKLINCMRERVDQATTNQKVSSCPIPPPAS